MTKGSSAARQDLRKRRGLSKLEQGYMGFVLILPWLIGFCIFKLYPFVSSLVYSFTDYDLFKGVQNVVGFQNYIDAFTKAKNVKALKVTFTYAFMTVPLKLIFALFIAYILNFKIKGVGLFRTAYYVPSILGGSVAIALAEVLADLARSHQVIVVTHLAQVAVRGDAHYAVTKIAGDDGMPQTCLRQLSADERPAEIARMLSGDATEASLAHAWEMLAAAKGAQGE